MLLGQSIQHLCGTSAEVNERPILRDLVLTDIWLTLRQLRTLGLALNIPPVVSFIQLID